MSSYYEICKPGIVKLVILTGWAGYGLGFPVGQSFSFLHFLVFTLGLMFISAGSLALNASQEWKLDTKMDRTKNRPIPSGRIKPWQGFAYSSFLILLGLLALAWVSFLSCYLGILTIVYYNILYTYFLKRYSIFAAVPGAVPGAAPVIIGYGAVNSNVTSSESIYVFTLMFLWQMPHFWSLAIKYKEDYLKGGFPVLPAIVGDKRTLLHMTSYVLPYVTLALLSPIFVEVSWAYYLLVIPVSVAVLFEFHKFYKSNAEKSWLRFFIFINISLLVFLVAPVLDKWGIYIKNVVIGM